MRVGDTGEVTKKDYPSCQPTFDFASFGFLFALMDLKEEENFRLLNIGRFDNLEPVEVAVKVGGRVALADANGVTHQAREIIVTNEPRSSLITFWVDDKPPYDYGWRFQLVSSGAVVSEKRFLRQAVSP